MIDAATDPGIDRRPLADGNRSAKYVSGNRLRRCSARNANMLPAGTRCPTNAAASRSSRSVRSTPCTPEILSSLYKQAQKTRPLFSGLLADLARPDEIVVRRQGLLQRRVRVGIVGVVEVDVVGLQ